MSGQQKMAKKSKKKKGDKADPNQRLIAENRKARHKYVVLDSLECGIALVGSEVKSLRNGRLSLDESYGRIRQGEVWLVGCDISEYTEASRLIPYGIRVLKALVLPPHFS